MKKETIPFAELRNSASSIADLGPDADGQRRARRSIAFQNVNFGYSTLKKGSMAKQQSDDNFNPYKEGYETMKES